MKYYFAVAMKIEESSISGLGPTKVFREFDIKNTKRMFY
jgi:hypothetical protein